MTDEEREVRLTAYALDDPDLTADERAEIDAEIAADAAVRAHVNEVRALAKLLSAGLAAEVAAVPLLSVPASGVPRRSARGRWLPAAIALLAVVGVGLMAVPQFQQVRESSARSTSFKEQTATPTLGFARVARDALRGEVAGAPFEAESPPLRVPRSPRIRQPRSRSRPRTSRVTRRTPTCGRASRNFSTPASAAI